MILGIRDPISQGFTSDFSKNLKSSTGNGVKFCTKYQFKPFETLLDNRSRVQKFDKQFKKTYYDI